MENKRGITLASNIGKTFERVINTRLIENLPFTEGQAGGRKDRSTIDQLFILTHSVLASFIKDANFYCHLFIQRVIIFKIILCDINIIN